MNVLLEYMYVCHVHTWCQWRSEERVRESQRGSGPLEAEFQFQMVVDFCVDSGIILVFCKNITRS